MKSSLIAAIMAVIISSSTSAETVSYPVGTVIEVTKEGVMVTSPDSSSSTASTGGSNSSTGGTTGSTGGTTSSTGGTTSSTGGGYDPNPSDYCYGADYSLVDCDQSRNFDPWIASTGERPYWIRNRLTVAIPFTLPSRQDQSASRAKYGYFQITSSERRRDRSSEDIFRVWFSDEPNGAPIGGTKCEMWMERARGNLYWTQDKTLGNQVCFLGAEEKVMYANFETACYPPRYSGDCSETNKQKSYRTFQFDVARYARGY